MRKDKWFAAVVSGEFLLIVLGLALPLAFPFPGQGALGVLVVITAFRAIFFLGIVNQLPGFQWPYTYAAIIFFLATLGNYVEMYRTAFGYAGHTYHWGMGLTILGWLVRGTGIGWFWARGRHIEGETAPADVLTAALVIMTILVFTPFGLFLMSCNRLFYGIFMESM